jgi:hypothetical protein
MLLVDESFLLMKCKSVTIAGFQLTHYTSFDFIEYTALARNVYSTSVSQAVVRAVP